MQETVKDAATCSEHSIGERKSQEEYKQQLNMASWTLRACVFLALSRLSTITCQSGEQFDQVLKDTMTLDSRVRPVKNASTTTIVTVSFHLMNIINLDTVEQKLLSNGFLTVKWDNKYFTWKPWEYGGVYAVNPDPDKVWLPRVTIRNTMKDLKPIGEDYIMIMALFNGTMTWFPAEHFETFCRVDVTYFPFDIQVIYAARNMPNLTYNVYVVYNMYLVYYT